MVSGYHSTIVKEADGTFKAWGQETSPNGTGDLLSPTVITSANGFNYIGTPLRATVGSGFGGATINHQYALLTTDGLYVWGFANMLISSSIKNTSAFGKITVNGKADGLPAGVIPQQVKAMFGSYGTLANGEFSNLLQKENLSIMNVIELNNKIFGLKDKDTLTFNQKHRSYDHEAILQILAYQNKEKLNNAQLANHFRLSRNTVSKWRKLYSNS